MIHTGESSNQVEVLWVTLSQGNGDRLSSGQHTVHNEFERQHTADASVALYKRV